MAAEWPQRFRAAAEEQARAHLPRELGMLHPTSLRELATALGAPTGEDLAASELIGPLTEQLAPLLWQPLGDCVADCDQRTPDSELALKATLFWRSAVALWMMPAAQLEGLARRREALAGVLPERAPPAAPAPAPAAEEEEDASPQEPEQPPRRPAEPLTPRRRLQCLRAFLPLFSMAARTSQEAREAAARREQRERERKRIEEERRLADEEERRLDEAAAQAPGTVQSAPQQRQQQPVAGRSAADHTYDKGYARWERFDAEAEAEVVDCPAPAEQRVPVSASQHPGDAVAELARRCEELRAQPPAPADGAPDQGAAVP
eukprot:TRINITY_DN10945_c0_g1_i1.p1 TRINITY_DN10945_c0_g1~~TRINITY_DN10945_c0_g1_i1.p1  ORF type:complete len:344 (+),score=113.27 TRINITY_DN10945_c0_g1_i1:78-1034(+)